MSAASALREWEASNPRPEPAAVAPGTPDRRRLRREAVAAVLSAVVAWHRASDALRDAVAREARSAVRRQAALARAADPLTVARRHVQRALRAAGFVREHTSGSHSTYYAMNGVRVRVADHELPQTDERRYNRAQGWRCCEEEILLVHRGEVRSTAQLDAEVADVVCHAAEDDAAVLDGAAVRP